LFCLPFSGGGASLFHGWCRLFPPEIEISPLHLPGREERIGEPPDVSPAEIAEVLAGRIDLPYAVYGHSFGGRLGFEVLRSLRALGVAAPVRFYPAASLPPDASDTVAQCVELPDGPFLNALVQRLGAPPDLRDLPELRQLLLPVLRHDMAWCHRYRYHPGLPLQTAIVAVAGTADTEATPAKMRAWARHGERFRLLTVPAGHFFLQTATRRLTALLTQDLLRALDETAPPVPPEPAETL
jgi:surfactin synthase thioesterase subunit